MNRSMVLLVHPPVLFTDADDEDQEEMRTVKDKAEFESRWDEFKRLQKVFESLGFLAPDEYKYDGKSFTFCGFEGMNWEGSQNVEVWTISDANIQHLEDKAEKLRQLREQAMAKLSTEELVALGVLKQE